MKRFLFSCLLALAIPITLIAQKNPYVNATFYLASGEVLEGEVDSTFAKRSSFKVFVGDETFELNRFKIDSVHMGKDRFIVQHLGKNNYVKRVVTDGAVDLYEFNGRKLILQADSMTMLFLRGNLNKLYWFFCQEPGEEKKPKMSKDDFVNAVMEFNAAHVADWDAPNYQFAKIQIDPVIFKLSFLFVPSLSAEVRLSKSFSFYSDIGVNFFGDYVRDAKTFVNPHATAEVRYYFSNASRLRKGRSIHNFTGHHFAVNYNYLMDSGVRNREVLGVVYGWQACDIFPSGFWRVRVGLGQDLKTAEVVFLSGISIGWHF